MLKGIDVSEHNGTINWQKVKNAGINFAIIRLGWIGNKNNHTIDKKFEENYNGAKSVGIKVGVYVYSYVNSSIAMQNAIEWVQSRLSRKTLEYPVFLDVEDEQIASLDKGTLTILCKQFCERITGFQTGVYANLNWFTNKLYINELVNYKIWLAQWANDYSKDFKVDMWQYTSDGQVNGIEGRVDLNYCLNCENNSNIEEITGETNNIERSDFEMVKSWKNGSTNETVYSDLSCTEKIGTIYPGEYADCYGIIDGKYLVCYFVTNSSGQVIDRKVGFVKYNGGVK